MPQLGVQIIGSTIGLRASLDEAVAAADKWAEATEASGVRAARGLEITGLAAKQAEIAYARLGMAQSRYAEGTVGAEAAAVRYEATVQGLYDKQVAAADAAAAAQVRASVKYESSLRSVGRAWTTYLTVPLAAVGYASIKLATEFQSSMTRVQTYAGASSAEVKRMSADILNSANQLPQGPIKAAEGLYHLESIGLRGSKAFETLKASAIAAGAGQADLTDSTTALGGAMVANIKGAEDAKQAMAGLISIAGQGNMTMQDLANALGTGVLVKARDVGVSLREVGAAMDVLVDRGIPARRAATYLGTTFALMVAPSKEAQGALTDMGVSWEKMRSTLAEPNGLLKVLEMLHAGIDRVGNQRGMADLMSAFGRSRQSTGIQTLVESLNAPVSNYAQKLAGYDKGVQDASKRMAEYQQTASYKMHTALSELEADFIKIGQGAAPAVGDAIKMVAGDISGLVHAVEGLPGPAKEALGVFAAALAVGGPIILGIAGAMKLSRSLANVLGELGITAKSSSEQADTGITSIGAAAEVATGQVEGLNAALTATGEAGVAGGVMRTPGGVILPPGTSSELTSETESAVGLGAVNGIRGALGTAMGRLGTASMYGIGGLLAGQVVQSTVGGQTGSDIGTALQMGGLGAGIGTMIEPGIGTAVGGGIGLLAGGIMDLINSSGSFSSSMETDSQAIQGLQQASDQAAAAISTLKLSRMQLQDQVRRDQAIVHQDRIQVSITTPGSSVHTAAVRQLQEAELALKSTETQLKTTTDNVTNAEKKQADVHAQLRKKVQDTTSSLLSLEDTYKGVISQGTLYAEAAGGGIAVASNGAAAGTKAAAEAAQNYAEKLVNMASQAQKTDPHLANVYRYLALITEEMNRMPTKHEIEIVLKMKNKELLNLLNPGGPEPGFFPRKAVEAAEKANKPKPEPHVAPLTQAQQIQIAFANNKYDRKHIEDEIKVDNENIRRLQRLRNEGKINNIMYVQEVTAYYQDRQTMYEHLKTLDSKARTATSKAQTKFDQSVTHDNYIQQARVDLSQGEYAAAQHLLAEDKKRLEVMLREAKTSTERYEVEKQIAEVERVMHEKSAGYQTALATQVAMARADAIAALNPNLIGPTSLQIELAKKAKAQAMAAINSHTLTMQGLIAAWQVVQQSNSVLSQQTLKADLYHSVSTDAVADSIKGLTAAQEMQLREKLAQRDTHRGYAPNGAGADGYVVGGSGGNDHRDRHRRRHRADEDAARSGGGGPGASSNGTVVFDGAVFHIEGVQNVRELAAELERLSRSKGARRAGARR